MASRPGEGTESPPRCTLGGLTRLMGFISRFQELFGELFIVSRLLRVAPMGSTVSWGIHRILVWCSKVWWGIGRFKAFGFYCFNASTLRLSRFGYDNVGSRVWKIGGLFGGRVLFLQHPRDNPK